jgi:hypothetical protein
VWHLNEAGNNTAGNFKDASSNANNAQGSKESSGNSVAGVIGNALTFTGTECVNIPLSSTLNFASSSCAISVWVKNSTAYTGERLIFEHGDSWGAGVWQLTTYSSTIERFNFNGSSPDGINYVTSWSDGNWHYMTVTFDTASHIGYVYIDGALGLSLNLTNSIGSLSAASHIGSRGGTSLFCLGTLDELRVSTANRSASWIKTEYRNQKNLSSFLTFDAERGRPAATFLTMRKQL